MRLRVRAPATSANLGPGFDVFGLALREPYDVVEAERIPDKRVEIEVLEGYRVPAKPEENTGGYVVLRMMEEFVLSEGVGLRVWKGIRPGSGLGSSAATAAAAAYAVNKLFDLGLSGEELVRYAALGELVSAGAPHLDNVAPAIYGGFTMVSQEPRLKIYRVDPPPDLGVVVVLPDVEKGSTRRAREVVPREVPLRSVARNVASASILAAGMALKNINMVKEGMNDVIVEPARARAGIIPEYEGVKRLGEELDAGIAVSGAGPAVICVIEKGRRKLAAEVLEKFYASCGYEVQVYVTEPGPGVAEIG
jgi:homoserine kinase